MLLINTKFLAFLFDCFIDLPLSDDWLIEANIRIVNFEM